MGLRHFERTEREVFIGGRKIGFGPLSRVAGGKDYLVKALSVPRWVRFSSFVAPFLNGGPITETNLGDLIKTRDVEIGKIFLPLILGELIRPEDLKRATKSQILSAWFAFCEVNDLAFIQRPPKDEDEAARVKDIGLTYDDLALQMAISSSGAYTAEELLNLPMHQFLSLNDSFNRLDNVANGRPADAEKPTDKELAEIRAHFESRGIEVV